MQRILFDYSLKNIGLPSKDAYRKRLIEKVEHVVSRMRWKAHFFLNGPNITDKHTYGLKSKKSPPPITQMKRFEQDLARMIENIEFRKVNDKFLTTLDNDLQKIKSSPNVYMFADKSRNIYESPPDVYDKTLKENITKTYKLGSDDMIDDINYELLNIASDLNISDRIETMAKREAFITVKDHKENFEKSPKFRLINPAKSELGKVSKVILDDINSKIRTATGFNQWKDSQSVIEWFKDINNKANNSFLSFDIAEFYPSITEELLDKAIKWAMNFIPITEQHISIIKHARILCYLTMKSLGLNATIKVCSMSQWEVSTEQKFVNLLVYSS